MVPQRLTGDFERALALLRSAWKSINSLDTARRGLYVCANLVSALNVAGAESELREARSEGLAIDSNYASLVKHRAAENAENGEWMAALDDLRSLSRESCGPEDMLALANAELNVGNVEEALNLAKTLCGELEQSRLKEAAAALRVEASMKLGSGLSELEPLLLTHPDGLLLRSVGLEQFSIQLGVA
jgi:thioredoxin-like negative regulator of GroEL